MKKIIPTIVVIFTMILFTMIAAYEYKITLSEKQEMLLRDMETIKLNLENIINTKRMTISGFVAFIELNKDMTDEEFDYYAENVFEDESGIIKNISFLKDTTIINTYPYEENHEVIGVDLSKTLNNSLSVMYVKTSGKSILMGPINLIQGGSGIILRMPAFKEGKYYGQVSIVFNYEQLMEKIGISEFSKSNLVQLYIREPIDNSCNIIWSNTDKTYFNMVDLKLNLTDISMNIRSIPKNGFNAFSGVIFLILIVGISISFLLGYFVSKTLKTHEKLRIQFNKVLEKEDEIKRMAFRDPLTDLFNRRMLEDDVKALGIGKEISLCLIDLDDFRKINDSFGHSYGDKVLIYIADLMNAILGENGKSYRIGGDEFVILVFDSAKCEYFLKIFLESLSNQVSTILSKHRITASIGVSTIPFDGVFLEDLLMKADIAMYRAKALGKNRYTFYNEEINNQFIERMKIEEALQEALKNDGFKVLYQPIVESETGNIISFEALIRMKNNRYTPSEFISIAEENGLILTIGRYVIKEVLGTILSFNNRFPIAINISPKQLFCENFAKDIKNIIINSEVPFNLVSLEITEGVFIDNKDIVCEILHELRSYGIKMYLDDFGTGFSSLSYITQIPVDLVKIDKSIKDQLVNKDNREAFSGLVKLIKGLDKEIVIEGVENESESDLLLELGCYLQQGYYHYIPRDRDYWIEKLEILK
ncbi:MAG: bifunctional diguanylate cyclase/phosphodiesterase [Proteocatella sp.]